MTTVFESPYTTIRIVVSELPGHFRCRGTTHRAAITNGSVFVRKRGWVLTVYAACR